MAETEQTSQEPSRVQASTGQQAAGADSGEAMRPYRQILTNQIKTGLGELERPTAGLMLPAFSAGLDVGSSVFLMAVMLTLLGGALPVALLKYGHVVQSLETSEVPIE